MNHVDPSISSGSSPGMMISGTHRLLRTSLAALLVPLPFRPVVNQFDANAVQHGGSGIRVDTNVLSQMRSNSRTDPTVVPSGYLLSSHSFGREKIPIASGKNGNAGVYSDDRVEASKTKTELTFNDWLLTLPESERPTPDSYKLWFGDAPPAPIQASDRKKDPKRLLVVIPELGGLGRSELAVLAGQRKHLFRTYIKYLRQREPELFKHAKSQGPNDIRIACARCGGNYTRSKNRFVCGDCGLGAFDKINLAVGEWDPALGDPDDPNPLTKIEGKLSLRNPELTIQEFASVALANRHRYKGSGLKARLILAFNYLTAQNPTWTLKDYADSVSMPENTADSWIKRFRKDVAEFRLAGRELVDLNGSEGLALREMLGLHPQKVYILEDEFEKLSDPASTPLKTLHYEGDSEAA